MAARVNKKTHTLTLEISGSRITADKFRKEVNAFLDAINEVVKDFSGASGHVRWIVTVSPGSAILHLRPETTTPRLPTRKMKKLMSVIHSGFEVIETTSTKPPHFNDVALSKAKEMASIVDGGLESIKIRLNEETTTITDKTLRNVTSLLATTYKDWGTIEGTLEGIFKRGEYRIWIYDDLLNKEITCLVPSALRDEVLNAFEKRVSAFGLIHYRRGGEINSIEVENFEVLPDSESLPSFDQVYGIFRGMD